MKINRCKPHDKQPKGDAMAIAEAYRRKKKNEGKKKIRLGKEVHVHRPRVEKKASEKSQRKLDAHKVCTCTYGVCS